MTKTLFDGATDLVRQISELKVQFRAVDHTDNEGEPCEHCQLNGRVNVATAYGTHLADGEKGTMDCCAYCVPAVARAYFDQSITVLIEVSRG